MSEQGVESRTFEVAINLEAAEVFGPHNVHLERIEELLKISCVARGNTLTLSGTAKSLDVAERAIARLVEQVHSGRDIDAAEVDAAVRMSKQDPKVQVVDGGDISLKTRKKTIQPRTPNQAAYLRAMEQYDLIFGLGPAGTGKTYLAVAMAVSKFLKGEVDRIILSRPAVEAGESLGFLPGDLKEKVDPYLRPLYDALNDMLPADQLMKRMESGDIEIAPLAFMRGRTLSNAFVIVDEAQNTTAVQMKMLLTRLGEGSRMVINGDLTQVDLPRGVRSGLRDALDTLQNIDDIGVQAFDNRDVVRHGLVAKIVEAYAKKHPVTPYEHDPDEDTSLPGI